jgi:lipoyl(octanoyl) transferase
MGNVLQVITMGRVPYREALNIQYELREKRQYGLIGDTLLLLEHPPVLTLGRQGEKGDILLPRELLEQRGIDVAEIERGGEVTYHGPGQIVGYLFFHMDIVRGDVGLLISRIEEVIIRVLKEGYGIRAGRDPEHRGVWLGMEKIAAVGIAIRKRVTMHGFAFNVNTDLSHFSWIVPCGIRDRGVTSLEHQIGSPQDIEEVKNRLIGSFVAVFGYSGYVLQEELE